MSPRLAFESGLPFEFKLQVSFASFMLGIWKQIDQNWKTGTYTKIAVGI